MLCPMQESEFSPLNKDMNPCHHPTDIDSVKKFNVCKFITTLLIVLYRLTCLLLMSIVLFLMTLGHDFTYLMTCDTLECHRGKIILLMFYLVITIVFLSMYYSMTSCTTAYVYGNWFLNSLFGWHDMDYVHCYAVSIIFACIPIIIFGCHCIGYVTNIIIFGIYNFFVLKSAISGYVVIIILLLLIGIVWLCGRCIRYILHEFDDK